MATDPLDPWQFSGWRASCTTPELVEPIHEEPHGVSGLILGTPLLCRSLWRVKPNSNSILCSGRAQRGTMDHKCRPRHKGFYPNQRPTPCKHARHQTLALNAPSKPQDAEFAMTWEPSIFGRLREGGTEGVWAFKGLCEDGFQVYGLCAA